jgi:hypothetical protein
MRERDGKSANHLEEYLLLGRAAIEAASEKTVYNTNVLISLYIFLIWYIVL